MLDHELLERMAEEMHVNVRLLDNIDEQHVPWLVERMEAFSSMPFVSEGTYVRQLLETILSLGAAGTMHHRRPRCRPHFPPCPGDPRPPGGRVCRSGTNDDARIELTLEDAEQQVKTLDQRRTTFIKNHFHCDPAAPENYDLVLNTSRLGVETCAQLIMGPWKIAARPGPAPRLNAAAALGTVGPPPVRMRETSRTRPPGKVCSACQAVITGSGAAPSAVATCPGLAPMTRRAHLLKRLDRCDR